jgi:hypothetical protein
VTWDVKVVGWDLVAPDQIRNMEIEPKYVAVALERLAGMNLEPELKER